LKAGTSPVFVKVSITDCLKCDLHLFEESIRCEYIEVPVLEEALLAADLDHLESFGSFLTRVILLIILIIIDIWWWICRLRWEASRLRRFL